MAQEFLRVFSQCFHVYKEQQWSEAFSAVQKELAARKGDWLHGFKVTLVGRGTESLVNTVLDRSWEWKWFH